MYYKSKNGITIVMLIVTIVIMLALAAVAMEYGKKGIELKNLEDLKTTMLLIKGRAKIVVDKESIGESYDNTGMLNLSETAEYDISNLQNLFNKLEDTSNLYIWEQVAMDNNNIQVTITNTDFFVIDYLTGEVYYSLGFTYEENTYYSLTEIQNIKEK